MTNDTLRILQCNLGKSRETTDSILNHPDSAQFALLLLQEQYYSTYLNSSLLHHAWTLVEAATQSELPPRSAIYINNRVIDANAFKQYYLPFSNVTAIEILGVQGQLPTLIINVYNPPRKDLITPLRKHLQEHLNCRNYSKMIIAGDFNLHHPIWNPPTYHTYDVLSDELLEMMSDHGLTIMLPPGTITYPCDNEVGGTTIDLVWGNELAVESVIKCKLAKDHDHGSDHHPIETILDMDLPTSHPAQPGYNYLKTEWNLLEAKLAQYLPEIITSHPTPAILDQYAADITDAIQRAISDTTPRKRPSPFSKRWWNEDLTKLRREANAKRRRYQITRSILSREEWREKRNEYKQEIRNAKEMRWKEFVEEADERTIWMVKKFIDAPTVPHFIPTINKAMSNEEKADEFRSEFFPPPPPADISDILTTNTYPPPVPCEGDITMLQLERAISKLSPDKAPGPDEITNRVLKRAFTTIQYHLLRLVQASIKLGHFPSSFKTTTTVVLRKIAKPDYTKPNAYRPVALENTLGKVIESVMTEIVSYLVEEYQLLPPEHFGGRPGRTTEDAMIILTERIYRAWRAGEIYSVVFMDVAGAFNNVHHKRLLDNMRKRRMPPFVVKWTESFLKDRVTQLRFNGVMSRDIRIEAGIPQGSPMSPILFMCYNAELLEIPVAYPGVKVQRWGFIDDIAFGVQGMSDEGNAWILQQMLEDAEGWRRRHGARFETTKYLLNHFTRKRKPTTATIRVGNVIVSPSENTRYLGVVFDKQLRFKNHLQQVAQKGAKFAHALARIAKVSWGARFCQLRQLFTSVVAARTDYGAVVWHRPAKYGEKSPPAQVKALAMVQRTAMKAILGCFRTTSTAALEVETALAPSHLRLQSRILRSLTRMRTVPDLHPITSFMQDAARTTSRRHVTGLEYLLRSFPDYAGPIETIKPFIRPPWWVPVHAVTIKGDKKEAKRQHDEAAQDPGTIQIYTDGSGIAKHIGAAAYCPQLQKEVSQYLGRATEYTVFAAEVRAMNLAVDILLEPSTDISSYSKCVIYVDSQPAITATTKPIMQSGQKIIADTLEAIDEVCQRQLDFMITIIWIPGHMCIEGNDKADAMAREATKLVPQGQSHHRYKPLKAAQNQAVKEAARNEWERRWREGTREAQQLRRISINQPVARGHKLYSTITKRHQVSTIARLRTGHCSLNQYLHRFHITETPLCECGSGSIENVNHFLLHCGRYDRERAKLIEKVGVGGMRVENLLGYPELLGFTLKFIESTGRFKF